MRFAAYALVTGLCLQAIVVLATGGMASAIAREDGPVELAQVVLAFASALLFVLAGRRSADADAMFALFALAAVFAGIRELDGFLDHALAHGAYKIFETPVVAGIVALAWRRRRDLARQAAVIMGCPTGYLTFFGALVVLVHAQVLGQKELWIAVLPGPDSRTIKKVFEECSELTGYLMLWFAALEAWLRERRSRVIE